MNSGIRSENAAAHAVIDVMTTLAQAGDSVVTRVLDGKAALCDAHYPPGDEVDAKQGFRYYYHSHAGRPWNRIEHGHFHLFHETADAFHHLVAISVDERGLPRRLFTTNRWVTGEQWQDANTLHTAVQRFGMQEQGPLAPVTRWINAMVRLFQNQIDALIVARDQRLTAAITAGRERERFLEDRRTHILSQTPLSLMERLDAIS